jgi:NADPH:quinone reductase-like Zn-dependent oxidoreductase
VLALLPTGGPDLVELASVAEPQVAPGEALVAVDAFSVNRGELLLLERPPAGWRPGKDVSGRVIRAAADGTGPAAGERVVGHPPAAGWAERVAVPTDALALRADVAPETAAALPLAGLTALRLLRAMPSPAGRRLLITGASGGVGHFLVELAAGAEITVVSRRPERLLALGATAAVSDVQDADGPFDVVLESVGGPSLATALHKVAPGGLVLWFGQASRTPAQLDFFDYFDQTGATLRHFHYEDGPPARDLATLVRLVSRGALHPELGVVAGWERTAAVLADLRERRITGNAVLTTTENPT